MPMKPNERGKAAVAFLKHLYPDAICSLEHGNDPFKLLAMACLSAQCTDARVNIVSKELFYKYPDADSMAEAPLEEIENLIRSCGLYKSKAKRLKEMSEILVSRFDGRVPDNMDDLLTLPGVGRKVANLVLGDVYNIPGIVTDTHCIRICGRLGFYPESEKNPIKIEKILSKCIEPEEQSEFCHRLVLFGREYCSARSPRCDECSAIAEEIFGECFCKSRLSKNK